MRVYIGWDIRDDLAFKVCERSLLKHATVPVDVVKMVEYDIRKRGIYRRTYHTRHDNASHVLQRIDDIDGKPFSTDFSFLRFAVPTLEDFGREWVLFVDPDVLWRGDIAELIEQIDESKAVCVVKHTHVPNETYKMDGVVQTRYRRKNWSSLMAIRPDRCRAMNKLALNWESGAWLHALGWVTDDMIGEFGEEWNWLEGHSSSMIDPKLVHFTRGTPDMLGQEVVPYDGEWRSYLCEHERAALLAA